MTYDEISRLQGSTIYWVFRGKFSPRSGDIPVVWSTVDVATDQGLLRASMEQPGKIRNGFPETVGGSPERASVELTLLDFDGSLSDYFTGGVLPADEGIGPSFYNLTGKLYVGAKLGDETAELEVTPTLVLSGSPSRKDSRITLPLASRDALFSKPLPQIKVRDIVDSSLYADPVFCYADRAEAFWNYNTYPVSQGYFSAMKDEFTENLDTELVFPYGKYLTKPVLVTSKNEKKPRWILGCFKNEPGIFDVAKISLRWSKIDRLVNQQLCVIKAQVSVPALGGDLIWVVFLVTAPRWTGDEAGESAANASTIEALDSGLDLVAFSGDECRVGFKYSDVPLNDASPPWASEDANLEGYANPVALLHQIVRDWGDSPTFDMPAWRYASNAMQSVFGIGGCLRSGQTLLDVMQAITAPFNIQLAILPNDSITISIFDEVTPESVSNLALFYEGGTLVTNFEETIPVDAVADGAIASRIEIEWPSETKDLWEGRTIPNIVPGFDRTPMVSEAKASIPGDFLSPDSASITLRGLLASKKFGNRLFRFGVEIADATANFSKLVRVTTSEGAKKGGYVGRLAKIIRYEILPEAGYAEILCKDLGSLEDINWGLYLDTEKKWSAYLPSLFDSLTLDGNLATFDNGSFDLGKVAADKTTLWIYGVSYRITKVFNTKELQIEPKFPTKTTIKSNGLTSKFHRLPWVVMYSHSHENVASRAGYIRLASTLTERFTNNDDGYRFRGV